MIDTKLITFLCLCETKSYTKTAEKLFVTQPSVTHHIKMLEKNYNVKLFDSNGKNLSLTKQGELLYLYAKNLSAYDLHFERVLKDSIKNEKTIICGVTPNIKEGYFKELLPKILKEFKNYIFSMQLENYDSLIKRLLDGHIDYAIIDGPFNRRQFNVIPLFKTKLVFAVGKRHPLASLNRLSFDRLFDERFFVDLKGTAKRDLFEQELKNRNYLLSDIKNLVELNDPNTIKEMVIQNHGISVFYESDIEDEVRSGKLFKLDLFELKRGVEFNLIYLKNNINASRIEKIAKTLIKLYKELNYLKYSTS